MKNLTIYLNELERGSKQIFHDLKSADLEDKLQKYITSGKESVISFEMTAEKIGGGVLLSGRFKGSLYLTCSRCAEEFDFKLGSDFRQVFIHITQAELEEEKELSEEELETDYFSGQEINIEPYLKDLIALEVPMVPVCSPSCKGVNYNKPADEASSPWAALKNFKVEHKNNS